MKWALWRTPCVHLSSLVPKQSTSFHSLYFLLRLHFKTKPDRTKWSKYIQLYFFKTLPPSAYIPNAANITTKSATFAFSSLVLFFYFFLLSFSFDFDWDFRAYRAHKSCLLTGPFPLQWLQISLVAFSNLKSGLIYKFTFVWEYRLTGQDIAILHQKFGKRSLSKTSS